MMRRAAVIGSGPAGLMAAERLVGDGVAVTVYDRMASPARKFLLAGRGGLNLTHSEPLEDLLRRYCPRGRPAARRDRSVSAGRGCGRGAKHWDSRPSSAPAAECFPRR